MHAIMKGIERCVWTLEKALLGLARADGRPRQLLHGGTLRMAALAPQGPGGGAVFAWKVNLMKRPPEYAGKCSGDRRYRTRTSYES
jgi:hypothetical protein